jgi:hypothetical protein
MTDEVLDPCPNNHGIAPIWCRDCKKETNHKILHCVQYHLFSEIDDPRDYEGWKEYQIAKCLGCDELCFRTIATDNETIDQDGNPVETIHVFPEPAESRALIADYMTIPSDLRRIYKETVSALNLDHPVLAGIGLRAIIETVVKDRNATGSNLKSQIDSLVKTGVLTQTGADILHKLRVLGNKAAHEVKAHKTAELILGLDVIENLLNAVYVLPDKAAETFK